MDAQTPNNPNPEIWQVDAGGEIYQGTFDELTQWITEGAVLPQDKVRRGNLRWIEAQKVPTLLSFFNAKDSGTTPPVVTTNSPKPFPQVVSTPINDLNQPRFCLVHIETQAEFTCDGCANFFCKECPTSFGGTVKVCPMCGAMCKSLEKMAEETKKTINFERRITEGFGFADFTKAFAYPFKYRASFVFGALFYAFFTVGQQASSLGGRWLISSSIICWMLANMLTFGILANTVENMLQGKLDQNFMPGFDNFSLWDDLIHPLFLSISVHLVSFGGLIILFVAMFFFAANSLKPGDSLAEKTVQTVAPEAAPDFSAAQQGDKQIEFFKEVVKKQNEQSQQRLNSAENGETFDEIPPVNNAAPTNQTSPVYDEEKEFENLNNMINQTRKVQLESAVGKPSEEEQTGFKNMYQQILVWAGPFILLAGLATLWGVFYLPVAYIVAAYTRNIRSVFNPSIGLDTIKRLGVDYVKILLMGFVLWIIGGVAGIFLGFVFAPFDLPRLGNIPVIAVGSIITFYLSIVFAVILGSALYKNSEKFPLFKTF